MEDVKMVHVGGLRIRLIHDSIFRMIEAALTELGWLDSNRQHKPVSLRYKQVGNDELISGNVVCVTVEDSRENLMELGSELAEHSYQFYIDVYGESDVFSLHLATDLRDILKGRFNETVSVGGPELEVYDYSIQSATPVPIFWVSIEEVQMDRARFFEKPFQEHWVVISFNVTDIYDKESDV